MTLNDLKTGMIVTIDSGEEYCVVRDGTCDILFEKDVLVNPVGEDKGWIRLTDYNSDFKYKSEWEFMRHWDIVKVEKPRHFFGFFNPNHERDDRIVLWKREKVKKLTVSEIEKLLGYKVEIVSEEE